MNSTRRNFIKLSGAAAAAGILGLNNPAFGQKKSFSAAVSADSLSYYNAENFREFIGTEFTLFNENEPSAAVLTAVKDFAGGKVKSSRNKNANCFTLSFEVEAEKPQATYTVFQRRLGSFDLFLVPGKSAKGTHLLHAVFNCI